MGATTRNSRLRGITLLLGVLIALGPSGALAKSSGGGIKSPYGNDISYPQCGTSFPVGEQFGLVGVDDGIANKENPCLGPDGGGAGTSELYWASGLARTMSQPNVALYVNTADPGNSYNGQPIADWPTPGSTVAGLSDPYGQCGADLTNKLGANSPACAWVYGADMASLDVTFLSSASSALQAPNVSSAASSYRWWLDVETANTWQSSTADGGTGLAMNAAVLEGMLQYLKNQGVTTVGIYSTGSAWQAVTGGQNAVERNWTAAPYSNVAPSPLYRAPDWVPGARQQSGAISNCSGSSFTDGSIALTQWVQGSLDYDQGC